MGGVPLVHRMLNGTGMAIELVVINAEDMLAAVMFTFPSTPGSDRWLNNSSLLIAELYYP